MMKAKKCFMLVLAMAMCGAAFGFAGGDGSPGNPYQIATRQHLEAVNTAPEAHYILNNDIDLAGTVYDAAVIAFDTDHTTNSFVGVEFSGHFDGNGKVIRNLTLNTSVNGYIGLFGRIFGTVENLVLEAVAIVGNYRVGGLVGSNSGKIVNCQVTGTVTGGEMHTGGLVGLSNAPIIGCSANVTVSGIERVGGLVGHHGAGGSIVNSHAVGSVTANASVELERNGHYAGGLVGFNIGAPIANSYATGAVTSNTGGYIGGLIGRNENSLIANCYAVGDVTGDMVGANRWVGGLIGYNTGATIVACYAEGSVDAKNTEIGGLVGRNESSLILNCYATGDVTAQPDMGGLVGLNRASSVIVNSYSTGLLTGSFGGGGLVGFNESGSVVIDSFYDTTTSQASWSDGGTALATAAMQDIATFIAAGWEIDDEVDGVFVNWILPDGFVGYPQLYRLSQWFESLFADGDGTADNPYQVWTQAQLEAVNSELFAHYVLMDNIDLSGTTYEAAVIAYDMDDGSDTFLGVPFVGSFDGNGKSVSNLTVAGVHNAGLFGKIGVGGHVFALSAGAVQVEGVNHIGGLVGVNEGGTLSGCQVSGTVTGTGNMAGGLAGVNDAGGQIADSFANVAVSGGDRVGGLAGRNISDAQIRGSSAAGTVNGNDRVGGLVGQNVTRAVISGSGATGAVTGTIRVGGLVGQNWASPISDSYATGKVVGDSRTGGLIGHSGETGNSVINSSATGDVEATSNYVGGLIGLVDAGYLSNCHAAGNVDGGGYIGGLVGDNASPIIGSSATGDTTGTGRWAGGLVGFNRAGGFITDCYAAGDVIGGGPGVDAEIGGLVGRSSSGGPVSNCYATGTAQSAGRYVGGLVGRNYAEITDSYATGDVIGDERVGGLAGQNHGAFAARSFATGKVNGNWRVGGLVGENWNSELTSSYAVGNVVSTGFQAGGLVGFCGGGGSVANCFAHGSVEGSGRSGGLVGYVRDTGSSVSDSYSTGTVISEHAMIGGLVGSLENGTVTNAFWDYETSGLLTSEGGTGKTTAQMKSGATFTAAGWDFTTTWFIHEALSYPRLNWQRFSVGDVNLDGVVNVLDLRLLAQYWLESTTLAVDISGNGTVDFTDFSVLSSEWLLRWETGTDVFEIVPEEVPNEGILFVDHESAARSGHGHLAITECLNGNIIAFYANVEKDGWNGGHSVSGWSEYRISADGGQTWSAPYELPYSKSVWEGATYHSAMVDEVMTAPNGTIVAIVRRYDAADWSSQTNPVVVRSFDNGLTWTAPVQLDPSAAAGRIARDEASLVHNNTLFVLLRSAYESQVSPDGTRFSLYASTDNGATFTERSRPPFDVKQRYGAMGVLDDGRLIVYSYNSADDGQYLQYLISDDAGQSWSESGQSYLAKRIRNPQMSEKIGGFYFMHGRSGQDGSDPRHLVLYASKDGIHWDGGVFLNKGNTDDLDSYSTNEIIGKYDPLTPNRLLIQSSIAYDGRARVNVHHWWIDVDRQYSVSE